MNPHNLSSFFETPLKTADEAVSRALTQELWRQRDYIELIASENIVSYAVLQAMGTIFTNKYAEGYPAHRYYHGCEWADAVESLAIRRAQELFGAAFVNVQPHSGSQANAAVYLALLQPGETLLGMSLDAGGHLTHGARVSSSGKYYHSISYGLDEATGLLDYQQVEDLAVEHKPRLIVAGGSAYPRQIDFKRFRAIADKVGALLMVDMAHFAGLVAGGVCESPLPYADVVTTTTHKTLRGPRGGMILTNNPDIAKKINSAVFPGLQGGPLVHVIAAKAVALGEALQPSFKDYARQVAANTRAMGEVFLKRGISLVTGGTDTHLLLVDLRPLNQTGVGACDALAQAHIVANKNVVPGEKQKPSVTSGMRVGTPAATTRGFREEEFRQVAHMIADVLESLPQDDEKRLRVIEETREKALALCRSFPIYPLLG